MIRITLADLDPFLLQSYPFPSDYPQTLCCSSDNFQLLVSFLGSSEISGFAARTVVPTLQYGKSAYHSGPSPALLRTKESRLIALPLLRSALEQMTLRSYPFLKLHHDALGAPFLSEQRYGCSLSYTRNVTSVVTSTFRSVGLDIESPSILAAWTPAEVSSFWKLVSPYIDALPILETLDNPCLLWVSIEAILKFFRKGFLLTPAELRFFECHLSLYLFSVGSNLLGALVLPSD